MNVCVCLCVGEREGDKVIMPIKFHVWCIIMYFYKRSKWICIIKMENLNLNMRPLLNYKKCYLQQKVFF